MATESVTIPAAAIPELRRVIAFGMHATGEVQRVRNAIEIEELRGRSIPNDLQPISATGTDVISDFASALMWLDLTTPVEDTPRPKGEA